jgi:hypothetical protein
MVNFSMRSGANAKGTTASQKRVVGRFEEIAEKAGEEVTRQLGDKLEQIFKDAGFSVTKRSLVKIAIGSARSKTTARAGSAGS